MTVQMSYAGGAPQLALIGNIGAADSSFVASTGGTASGYPDGSLGDFVVLIGSGEKVLCSARSGTTFTVALGGRGYDGTSAAAWNAGATVEHVWDATSAQAASDHINDKVHTHAYTDVAGTWTAAQSFTSQDTSCGPGAAGGAGGFVDIGSSGVALVYAVAGSSASNADIVLAGKGTGGVRVRAGDVGGADVFVIDPTAPSSGQTGAFLRYHNGTSVTFQRVTLGIADSGGTGFKALRVPN